jgi:AcrR family transcriptional regulator
VSIRDIATALGLQPSTLYFHISSKQDLLYELTLIGYRAGYAVLVDALLEASADPRDQLRRIVSAHVGFHLEYPALARIVNRELHALDETQRETVQAIRIQTEQVFRDVIERGTRLGAFTSTTPYLDTKAIGAMSIRLPEWWTPDAEYGRDQIIENYSRYALSLVGSQEPTAP